MKGKEDEMGRTCSIYTVQRNAEECMHDFGG
jgi:hypothetical protein